jgi:hypothetical protein
MSCVKLRRAHLSARHFELFSHCTRPAKSRASKPEEKMRSLVAVAALAAALGACQPDSEKTNPAVATDEATAERMEGAPAAGASSFTQEQARERATAAGYMDVGPLTQAADGTWQGSAMKDGASVTVVVDYQGNVTTSSGAMPTDPAAMPSTEPPATTPGTTPTTPPT